MQLSEVRRRYLEYFSERGHVTIPSASLVPENDPTTLFTSSGMQPLVPNLLGEPHPSGKRVTNSQRCFRAEDIGEVGDNRHTTYFEMLGNWSFGDYFKKEQLTWFFTFLTEEIGLDPKNLYVTVFAGDELAGIGRDEESAQVWKRLFEEKGMKAKDVELLTEKRGGDLGMQGGRIFYYGAKKNWWSRSGVPSVMPEGEPGGPDSEVFYEFTDVEHNSDFGKHCHPNCDCGRFMEIGNSVFMEYKKSADGFFIPLPQKSVDFGGGLERITAATNGDPDIFHLDVFEGMRKWLEEYAEKKYDDDKRSFRIILDHTRAAIFMMADGVLPSNTEQGYILRRLLRRDVRYADSIGLKEFSLHRLHAFVSEAYKDIQPDMGAKSGISDAIQNEEQKFRKTLRKGLKEFERIIDQNKVITGKDAFTLFSTYGFPMEMTRELAEERGIYFDISEYQNKFQNHRDLSKTASVGKFKGGLADHSEVTTALHTVTHLMLAGLRKYLGDHVHQAGSNITSERTRFDFTYPEKVDREILDKVEQYVNETIEKGCAVQIEKMDKKEAKKAGVEGSFWEKYPETVNVYIVSDEEGNVYSRELCGGPHVENTGKITGTFRITKEQSSSAGVRRIKAVLE